MNTILACLHDGTQAAVLSGAPAPIRGLSVQFTPDAEGTLTDGTTDGNGCVNVVDAPTSRIVITGNSGWLDYEFTLGDLDEAGYRSGGGNHFAFAIANEQPILDRLTASRCANDG